jgi:predicted dithiol-disulfide oxidoreductase (DUF899 family)
MVTSTIGRAKIVSQAEWLPARRELLAKEKQLTRQRDELSRQLRELPWVKVEKNYVFAGPNGKETLGDLFGGRTQLIVSHFMLGPGWNEGCVGCSFRSDHVDGALVHLEHHDVSFVTISRPTGCDTMTGMAPAALSIQEGDMITSNWRTYEN